jgi:hypothetical protein
MATARTPTRLEKARELAGSILADFDKGLSTTKIARKCERLGLLINDEFIQAYVDKCMTWSEGQDLQSLLDWVRRTGPTPEASGVVQFLEDYKLQGPSVPGFLMGSKGGAKAEFSFLPRSLPSTETFVQNARKKAQYAAGWERFLKSIEQAEGILDKVATRLHRYVCKAYSQLTFGSIPESIFDATRGEVDTALAEKCPTALEKFAVAYEELSAKSSENWSNACLTARRILLDFADAVYAPRAGLVGGHSVGPEDYVNRLWAYASERIGSERTRDVFHAELGDLGARIDAVYDLASKGLHASITKAEADRIVIRTYLLLADLLSL